MNEQEIFAAALEQEADQRAAYLDAVCGTDAQLRRRVEKLLQFHGQAGAFFEKPAAEIMATAQAPPTTETTGTQIGPYTLLEQIGEGGMGAVWMAEQHEPVKRYVALKIIKPGMDSRHVIARFEAERQALSMMDHPNIARVLDAGVTGPASGCPGRPYFVMELVKGRPITEYCDEHHLTPRERLELFLPICQAIQHAHQKGIIHRDIKPSNILVAEYDRRPLPKVIDFGVAKAISQPRTEKTMFTGLGQIVGTLEYMSPEQASVNPLDVDTRSDIYSMGVLLYELLTGTTPFDRQRLRSAAWDEMLRIIREEEPPRPSTKLSTIDTLASVAANRQITPARLTGLVRGELDWIVMKALEKDRNRRYETASSLAADLQHYLNDEPVVACPPSAAYRFRKFARRNKVAIVTTAIVAASLVLGVLATSWQAVRATTAEWKALENERKAINERNQKEAARGEALASARRATAAARAEALQRKIATEQQADAERQRDAAEAALYAANMQAAHREWTTGQTDRLVELLDAHLPKPGRPDFRAWEWYYLFSLCHSERLAFPFQYRFAWSPDTKLLATADYAGRLNIWDVASGDRQASFLECPPFPHCRWLCWSPDGSHIALGTDRGVVVVCDVLSRTRGRSLMANGAAVSLIVFSRDGSRLASGGADGTITIWDARTWGKLSTLTGPSEPIHSLDWHTDGRQLVAVYGPVDSRELKIWDTVESREIAGWRAEGGPTATFSPDGSRLLWGMNPLRVTDLTTGKVVLSVPGRQFFHAAWSPKGDRLVSTSYSGAVKVCDAVRGTELRSIPAAVHPTMPIAWSPRGELVAAYSATEGTVKVWDVGTPETALSFPTAPNAGRFLWVAYSPNGKRLLVTTLGEIPRMVDVASGETRLLGQHPTGWLRRASWSPDGQRYAINACVEPPAWNAVVCDAQTGEPVLPQLRCDGSPLSLAWKPDGSAVAVGLMRDEIPESLSYHGQVKLFSTVTGQELAASDLMQAEKYDGTAEAVAWSPDGQRLAVAAVPLQILDTSLHQLPFAATGAVNCMDWSPDGRQLATGSKDGTISILDGSTGIPVHVLPGHGFVDAVRWHPSQPRLASGGRDGMVRIWDVLTGQEMFAMEAHTNIVRDLAWSPDGWQLAMTSGDGNVRILDTMPAHRFFVRHADLRAQVWKRVGRFYERYRHDMGSGEFAEALRLLEQLKKLDPEEKDVDWQMARVEWLRAQQLVRTGHIDQALAIFKRLSAQTPDLPDYHLQLPAILFDAGREAQALALLETTVADNPGRPEYHEELAYLYERRAIQLCLGEDVLSAGAILRKLAREYPERPGHSVQLTRQLRKQLVPEKCVGVLDQLIEEFPDEPSYRDARAQLERTRGELRRSSE